MSLYKFNDTNDVQPAGGNTAKTSALQSVIQSMDQSAPISVDVLVILIQALSEDFVGQTSKKLGRRDAFIREQAAEIKALQFDIKRSHT